MRSLAIYASVVAIAIVAWLLFARSDEHADHTQSARQICSEFRDVIEKHTLPTVHDAVAAEADCETAGGSPGALGLWRIDVGVALTGADGAATRVDCVLSSVDRALGSIRGGIACAP